MSWWKPHGMIHKTLCDGILESKFVFPLIREAGTQFYIKCPCCAFWRGIIVGGLFGVLTTSVILWIVWIVN